MITKDQCKQLVKECSNIAFAFGMIAGVMTVSLIVWWVSAVLTKAGVLVWNLN